MSTFVESGHEKNAANFDHLITTLIGFGTSYNPGNSLILISNLQTVLANAQTSLATEKTKFTAWKSATNSREILFNDLAQLSTRLLNMLIASSVPKQTVDDLRYLNRKIHGKRAKALPKTEQLTLSSSTAPVHISVSQRSFDSLTDHFSKIIVLLGSQPLYNPNETDLKVSSLQTLLTNMKTASSNAINAYTDLSMARIDRNTILYKETSGVLDLARAIKAYVKASFGVNSPEYALVKAYKFVRIVKR